MVLLSSSVLCLIFLSELPRDVDSCQLRFMLNHYISAASVGRVELASGCELCVVVLGLVDTCSAASHVWSFFQSCCPPQEWMFVVEPPHLGLLFGCCVPHWLVVSCWHTCPDAWAAGKLNQALAENGSPAERLLRLNIMQLG